MYQCYTFKGQNCSSILICQLQYILRCYICIFFTLNFIEEGENTPTFLLGWKLGYMCCTYNVAQI